MYLDVFALMLLAVGMGGAILLLWVLALTVRGTDVRQVDFEWNPFSIASRAAKAENAGYVEEALRLYAKAGLYKRIEDCLLHSLPDCQARSSLMVRTKDLLELASKSLLAQAAGVPDSITGRLVQESRIASDVLWHGVNRITAAAALHSRTTTMPAWLEYETEKLDRMLEAVTEAQNEIAKLTVSGGGGDYEGVERAFRRLAEAAAQTKEEMDETA